MNMSLLQNAPKVPPLHLIQEMTSAEREELELRLVRQLHDYELQKKLNLFPEGHNHMETCANNQSALKDFGKKKGKNWFVSSNIAVLYSGKKAFSPDLMVVFDVLDPEKKRLSWKVYEEEGKGLDFVLEVISKSTEDKDQIKNIGRYSDLEIPEYFIFDEDGPVLDGYSLKKHKEYVPLLPNTEGRVYSEQLNLYLGYEGDNRLAFYTPEGERLLYYDELSAELQKKQKEYEKKLEQEKEKVKRAEGEIKKAKGIIEQEKKKVKQAEKKVEQEKEKVEQEKEKVEQEKEKVKQAKKETEQAEKKTAQAQKEKLEIIKNFLDVLDDETISIKTKVSLEEIKKLRSASKR